MQTKLQSKAFKKIKNKHAKIKQFNNNMPVCVYICVCLYAMTATWLPDRRGTRCSSLIRYLADKCA